MLGIEAGLGAGWETGSEDAAGNGVEAGAAAEEEDAEVQVGTEGQTWIVVWEELAECAAVVEW